MGKGLLQAEPYGRKQKETLRCSKAIKGAKEMYTLGIITMILALMRKLMVVVLFVVVLALVFLIVTTIVLETVERILPCGVRFVRITG